MAGIHFILVGIGIILQYSERGSCCEEIAIEDMNDEAVNGTVYITRGGLLVLGCDGSCQGIGYPPNLKWYTPTGEKVSSFPGRIMSIHQQSRRRRKLYVQRFRWRDQGTYSCEGLIHGNFRKKSVKVLIRGSSVRDRE